MAWMLDTHALLWALFEPDKLGRKTRAILVDRANEVRISPVSYWEISIVGAALVAHLNDEFADFEDGLGERLLAVNVFAQVHRRHSRHPVEVVRGGDSDGVDRLIHFLKHISEVG